MRTRISCLLRVTALCVAVLGAWTTQAKAQVPVEECLMGPAALPGLGGAPTWFNPGSGKYRAELHDPRWAGTPHRLFASTGADPGALVPSTEAAYRILEHDGYLYVQYQALVDSNGLSSKDRVFFTFKHKDRDEGFGVRIDGYRATPPPPDPNVIHDAAMPLRVAQARIRTYSADDCVGTNATWKSTSAGAGAAWLEDVAVWQKSPGVVWAVTFRIKLTHPDLKFTTPFTDALKVAHAMRIHSKGGVRYFGSSALLNPLDSGFHGTPIAADSNRWKTTVNPAAPVCTSGITVESSNVGVWNGSELTGQIAACGGATPCPPPTDPGITNRFRVTVHNVPNPGAEKFALRTNMRITSWGSAYPSGNASWKKIENIPDDVFTANTSTLSSDSNWAWDYNSGSARTDYTCVAERGSYCPHLPSGTQTGAAMMVELAASPTNRNDPAFWFARNTVHRSMHFLGLSEINVPATIDMKGVPGGAHDVYLYVETKNMPPHGDEPLWLPTKAMTVAERYANNLPPIPPQADKRDLRRNYSQKELAVMKKDGSYIKEATEAAALQARDRLAALKARPLTTLSVPGMSGEQALDEAWPTYRVHVYYDTGLKTKDEDGVEEPVLAPMPSFGFYLNHDGPLYGFKHALEGLDDIDLESLGEGAYRVQGVAKDSSFRVATTISAEEIPVHGSPEDGCKEDTPPPRHHAEVPPHRHGCGCSTPGSTRNSPWMILALGALGLAVFRRRRFGS